jgi:ribosomal protein L19E
MLKEKKIIDDKLYRELYLKSKGGFFRSKRHIKIYLEERAKK